MSKEMIERAKEWRGRMTKLLDESEQKEYIKEHIDVMDWLIEQAERVQELKNVNRVLKKANEGSERDKERLRSWIDELEMENETLSSALHDARHEIRVLKNNIRTLNKIK